MKGIRNSKQKCGMVFRKNECRVGDYDRMVDFNKATCDFFSCLFSFFILIAIIAAASIVKIAFAFALWTNVAAAGHGYLRFTSR